MGPRRATSWVSRATTSTTTPWVIPPRRPPTSLTRDRRAVEQLAGATTDENGWFTNREGRQGQCRQRGREQRVRNAFWRYLEGRKYIKRVTEVVRTSELFGLLCKGVTESELLADDDYEKLWVNWSSLYPPTSLSFVALLVCFLHHLLE